MALVDPHPGEPASNAALNSQNVRERLNALAQAIQSFDGTQLVAGSVLDTALNTTNSVVGTRQDYGSSFVKSGLIIPTSGSLSATMTSGVAYVNGKKLTVSATPLTVSASKDTYIYLKDDGTVIQSNSVSNNATSPTATTNSDGSTALLVGIVISSGSAITTINQGSPTAVLPLVSSVAYAVTDGIGNLIYPTTPNPTLIGYRQIVADFTQNPTVSNTIYDVAGLTAPVIVPAGRRVKVTFFARAIFGNTTSGTFVSGVQEGSTVLGQGAQQSTVSNGQLPVLALAVIGPTVGLHTYKATVQINAVVALDIIVAPTTPAFITVELV